jgi:hypothetical protein
MIKRVDTMAPPDADEIAMRLLREADDDRADRATAGRLAAVECRRLDPAVVKRFLREQDAKCRG